MLLAIDAGNTQTHIGIFSGEKLVAEWRTATEAGRTADELALVIQEFLAFEDLSFSRQVTGVVIGSVVPSLTGTLREMVEKYFHFAPVVVEPGIKMGMPILYENPREVGADRIANAVAARALVGGPTIVVDFGTAITFDAISTNSEYLGGAIAPGITISSEALWTVAAQIQKVELTLPPHVIGLTTAESVRAGVLLGTASMVEGMVDRMQKELGGGAEVIATGGLAALILKECSPSFRHEPLLTLTGLRIIFDLNVHSA